MTDSLQKFRDIAGKGDPIVTGAAQKGITKFGLPDPIKEDVLTRQQAKQSQEKQKSLLAEQQKLEETRLAEEKSEVAKRSAKPVASRRTLLGG